MEFDVKYLDAKGVEQGPYPLSFDPETALYESIKNTYMAASERQWVHFQYWEADEDDPAYVNVIFPVLDYPCVVEKAYFAIDSDTPDQPLNYAECDPLKPLNSSWTVESVVRVPPDTGYVSLQVHYKDGEVTEVKRYPVKF